MALVLSKIKHYHVMKYIDMLGEDEPESETLELEKPAKKQLKIIMRDKEEVKI